MNIKAEVRSECAYTGECRTYRLSVEMATLSAPNPEHVEALARMLIKNLADEADEHQHDPDEDAEHWKHDGGDAAGDV